MLISADVGYLFSAFYNDRNSKDVCGGMNIKTFIDWLEVGKYTHIHTHIYIN